MHKNFKMTGQPGGYDVSCKIVGGTAAVSLAEDNAGIAIEYVTTGIVRLTFKEPGATYRNAGYMFSANAPGDLKGYTAVVDENSWDADARTIDVHIFDDSPALADLTSTQYLSLRFEMSGANVGGV